MPDTMINTDDIFATNNTTDNNSILPNDIDTTINHAVLLADMEQLFTEARPRLLRLARLNGMTSDVADDVVQETMMEAWRHLANLRDPQRFSAWLDGICRNVCRRQAKALAATNLRYEPLPHLIPDTSDETEVEANFPLPPDRYWVETDCPNCGKNESDIATILITHPVVQRFFLQHERGISEPYKLLDYNGQLVISARLTDVTSAEQLTILLNAQSLQILAVFSNT
jgi:hypothetical protein